MMHITCKAVFHRLPVSILLLAFPLFSASPSYVDTDSSPELTRVRALAEKGSINDEIVLAGDYFIGTGVKQDPKMAAYWYEKAAAHGSPEAENQIGYFYQAGIGVTQDLDKAFHWYQLSAASGYATAKVNLAVAYLHGLGTRKSDDLAVQFLTQAYEGGNGRAATYLGILSFFGIAMKEDRVAAESWFESAIKLHDPLAAYNLGSLYSVDLDHPHDLPRAADLLRQATDGGYVPAMHSLGLLFVNHPELKQGPDQAHTLLEAAANAGNWKSSVVLGILARDGRCGVPANVEQAYFHFRLAAIQGGLQAERLIKHDMDTLAAKIGGEESRKQNSAANNWFQHHSVTLAFVYKDGSTKRAFPAAAMADTSEGSFAGQLLPLASS
jgi:TPR repeat protein